MERLPRREKSVRGVGRLSFRRTHTSSGNEGSSTVIETHPVVAYLQYQGGTHSFSLHLLSPPDRSVCHQFELQTGDICLSNPRPESLGGGCNDHDYELCYLNCIMVAYLLLRKRNF